MKRKMLVATIAAGALFSSCSLRTVQTPPHFSGAQNSAGFPTVGAVERLSHDLDRLLSPEAQIELLARGFDWSEGPVWVQSGGYLLFSDVPQNVVYKWTKTDGAVPFLQPSGYTGDSRHPGAPGANGLTLDPSGRLVLAQHGDRRIARLTREGQFETLAEYYNWLRFNSPNDLVYRSNGDLYFTDPPYGLPKGNQDPDKELAFNGVFRLAPDGEIILLTADLTYPNGLAFAPDEKTLYVAVSDPERPVIMAYDVSADGNLGRGRLFFDASSLQEETEGLPDGLKVDHAGYLFATGPGGVLVITPQGRHLGTIDPGEVTANCAWGDDGSVLYMTSDTYLCRIQTRTRGAGH